MDANGAVHEASMDHVKRCRHHPGTVFLREERLARLSSIRTLRSHQAGLAMGVSEASSSAIGIANDVGLEVDAVALGRCKLLHWVVRVSQVWNQIWPGSGRTVLMPGQHNARFPHVRCAGAIVGRSVGKTFPGGGREAPSKEEMHSVHRT